MILSYLQWWRHISTHPLRASCYWIVGQFRWSCFWPGFSWVPSTDTGRLLVSLFVLLAWWLLFSQMFTLVTDQVKQVYPLLTYVLQKKSLQNYLLLLKPCKYLYKVMFDWTFFFPCICRGEQSEERGYTGHCWSNTIRS